MVGAGVVGLSTAWFLQEFGVCVTVIEAIRPGAGASWGNAGWVAPSLATPLPEPGVVTASLRGALRHESPLTVRLPPDLGLFRFVAQFMWNSRPVPWISNQRALSPLARDAVAALDAMNLPSGIQRKAELLVAFTRDTDRARFEAEVMKLREGGQELATETMTPDELSEAYPIVAARTSPALVVHDQRYVDPQRLVTALGRSVESRGGTIQVGEPVTRVNPTPEGVRVHTAAGRAEVFDATVIAAGAWLNELVAGLGVHTTVQAGRGYSFNLTAPVPPRGPLYFPAQRVACTPTARGLRVAGLMEFARPSARVAASRVGTLTRIARPLLHDVDWHSASDVWVGSRPCTPDGLPLLGVTADERVFVAGGHGMWGVTLAATSGRNLAQLVVTGQSDIDLTPLSPLRRAWSVRARGTRGVPKPVIGP